MDAAGWVRAWVVAARCTRKASWRSSVERQRLSSARMPSSGVVVAIQRASQIADRGWAAERLLRAWWHA
jgi:hypothetical protein